MTFSLLIEVFSYKYFVEFELDISNGFSVFIQQLILYRISIPSILQFYAYRNF